MQSTTTSAPVTLDAANAEAIVTGADVVVDCTDSFESRYLVNAACCSQGIPLVEAGLVAFEGLVLTVIPGRSACYRCVFPTEPPVGSRGSCRDAGVLGPMAGIVGSIQALEVLKLLAGIGTPLTDTLLQIDGSNMVQTHVATRRRPDCPVCGGQATGRRAAAAAAEAS